ncbi:MAG: DUF4340 domain-containing protein [Clostridia bacterium]|nr:DUF4340 domain-containing protein [Clostridia bacterium]
MKKTKTIVMFSVLGAVLLLLIGGLVFVLLDNDEPNDIKPTIVPMEGEDVFGNVLLAYPMFEIKQLNRVEIFSENGDFEFVKSWDEVKGDYAWRVKGYEDIKINLSKFEMLATWLSVPTTETPVRDATQAQLSDFGVDDSCKNGYAVYLTDSNGKEISYRVRIGNKAYSSRDVYYSYIEGRNHVYKLDNDIKSYTSYSKLSYMEPIINTFFDSETNAIMGIDSFSIYTTLGSDNKVSNILSASVSERSDKGVEFKIVYAPDEYGRKRTTIGSTSYLSEVFSLLYTSFLGNEIVAVSPSENELMSYGLGSDDEKYFIDATFSDKASFASSGYSKKDPSFYVSKNINGYRYVLSKYFENDIIVKLDNSVFDFLKTDTISLLKWTDTTSIKSGFYESITDDTGTGNPGLNKIVLKTDKNEETFVLVNEVVGVDEDGKPIYCLTVTAEKSGLVFKDDLDATLSSDKNQFRILFVNLLYYPFIESFNERSPKEVEEILESKEIAYSITAYRNDGTVVKYDYYECSPSLAMECAQSGKVNSDGTVTYDTKECNYIVTMTHIRQVCKVIDALLNGEKISDPV